MFLKLHDSSIDIILNSQEPCVGHVTPLYGPKSGGTRVTIVGAHLDDADISVELDGSDITVLYNRCLFYLK